jgi:hypothetical protein
LFGIVQPGNTRRSRKDHGGGDDRAGPRASSGFIETGNPMKAAPPGFSLKAVRGHRRFSRDLLGQRILPAR